jgi:DeoR/GlpR family transcriptional regulator of sugar metabolism
MMKKERKRRILAILHRGANARTTEIAVELMVSRETVRRDLIELHQQGEIDRVHGGAMINREIPEEPFQIRTQRNRAEKLDIARCALSLVKSGEAIFLDAGSTTAIFAEALRSGPDVQVITNLQSAANTLRERAFMLGGRYAEEVPATFGELTLANIRRFHVDAAVISPTALHLENGLTYYHMHECAVARAMCEQANRVIVLADCSKIGTTSRVLLDSIEIADMLVTGRGLRPELHEALARRLTVVCPM